MIKRSDLRPIFTKHRWLLRPAALFWMLCMPFYFVYEQAKDGWPELREGYKELLDALLGNVED